MISPQHAQNLTFSLKDCKCKSFALTDFGAKNKVPIDADKYQFNFLFTLNIDEQAKTVKIELGARLSGFSEIKDDLANLVSINEFLILNFDEIAVKNNDQMPAIPSHTLIPFFSVAISSLRGMYAVKLENTLYSNAILPLVDASQIIPHSQPPVS